MPTTQFPTIVPTYSPTEFPSATGSYTKLITFNQMNYKSQFQLGDCLSWLSFISRNEVLILDGELPISIEITALADDFLSIPYVASCNDDELATIIVTNIVSPTTEGVTTSCGGRDWTVKQCGANQAAVCADCEDPCYSTTVEPFVVGSCGDTAIIDARASFLTVTAASLAPGIVSVIATATEETISAEVTLTENGFANCAAFKSGTVDLTSTEMIEAQNIWGTAISGTVNLDITGLEPSTLYDVYCYSTSIHGSRLYAKDAVTTLTVVSTACCSKPIHINVLANDVFRGIGQAEALVVTVNSPPADFLYVKVTGTVPLDSMESPLLSGNSSGVVVFTEVLTFSSSFYGSVTLPIPASATLNGSTIVLNATVHGSTAGLYSVLYNGGCNESKIVHILDNSQGDEPRLPELSSAVFSSDGSYVIVNFCAATNKANVTTATFDCSSILSFSGDYHASCQWTSDSSLAVRTTSLDTRFVIGDEVSLRSDSIQAKCILVDDVSNCSKWSYAKAASVAIAAPDSGYVVNPVIAMTGPTLISYAVDDLTLELVKVTGFGGREWTNVSISVEFNNGPSVDLENYINEYILANVDGILQSIYIPPSHLSAGTYFFVLTGCNFLGGCGQGKHQVSVLTSTIPMVNILGPNFRTAKVREAQSFFSEATLAGVSPDELQYSWVIRQSEILFTTSVMAGSNSVNEYFEIPPFTFLANIGIEVEVIVLYDGPTGYKTAHDSVRVFIAQSDVIAVITGAYDQRIVENDSLVLDGGESYDEDIDSTVATGAKAGLLFTWRCVQSESAVLSSCGQKIMGATNTTTLTLYAPNNTLGAVSIVTLTVVDGTGRTAHSTVRVSTVQEISVFSNGNALVHVNENDKLKLFASVDSAYNGSAYWTVNDSSVDLAAIALTPSSMYIIANDDSSTTATAMNLVLRSNSLPSNSALAFTLHFGVEDEATTLVVVNGAPQLGRFEVSPNIGMEIVDIFTFEADNWFDDNLPLSYAFSYLSRNGDDMLVQSRSERPFTSTVLPAGAVSSNYSVACVLTVFDGMLAASLAQEIVTVKNSSASATQVVESYLNSISGSDSDNHVKTIQPIVVSLSVLNAVDCSQAPNCTALGRRSCVDVANTCGACLSDDLVGIFGQSNTQCESQNSVTVRTDNNCSDSSHCFAWEVCDLATSKCVATNKTCATSCSADHGSCQYINTVTGNSVDSCSWLQQECSAMCQCSSGWAGQDCSISTTEMAVRQDLRSTLAADFNSFVYNSLIDTAALPALLSALSSLTTKPSELSSNTTELLMSTALFLSSELQVNALSYDKTVDLLDAIDNLHDALLTLRQGGALDVTAAQSFYVDSRQARQHFMDSVAADAVPGETISFLKRNLRAAFGAGSSTVGGDVMLTLPLTSLEGAENVLSYDVTTVPNQTNIVLGALVMTGLVIESVSPMLAQPMIVDLNRECGTGECTSEISFVHNVGVTYDSVPEWFNSTEFSVYCSGGIVKTENFTCPNGRQVSLHCNGFFSGYLNSTCPYEESFPLCAELYGNEIVAEDVCAVISRSADSTTCSCEVPTTASNVARARRQLQTELIKYTTFEIVPIKKTALVVPIVREFSDPTAFPTSYPSTVPSLAPTSSPSIDAPYPIMEFTLKSFIMLRNVSAVGLSLKDETGIASTVQSILSASDSVGGLVTTEYVNKSEFENVGANTFSMLVTVKSYIYAVDFCTELDALAHFTHVLNASIVNSTEFTTTLHGSVESISLLNAVATSSRSIQSGPFNITQTAATHCTSTPTAAPTESSPSTGSINSVGSQSSSGSNSNSLFHIDSSYVFGFVVIVVVLLSFLYACMSNRNKDIFGDTTIASSTAKVKLAAGTRVNSHARSRGQHYRAGEEGSNRSGLLEHPLTEVDGFMGTQRSKFAVADASIIPAVAPRDESSGEFGYDDMFEAEEEYPAYDWTDCDTSYGDAESPRDGSPRASPRGSPRSSFNREMVLAGGSRKSKRGSGSSSGGMSAGNWVADPMSVLRGSSDSADSIRGIRLNSASCGDEFGYDDAYGDVPTFTLSSLPDTVTSNTTASNNSLPAPPTYSEQNDLGFGYEDCYQSLDDTASSGISSNALRSMSMASSNGNRNSTAQGKSALPPLVPRDRGSTKPNVKVAVANRGWQSGSNGSHE